MRQRTKILAGAAFAVSAIGIVGAVQSTRRAISQEPQSRYTEPQADPQSRYTEPQARYRPPAQTYTDPSGNPQVFRPYEIWQQTYVEQTEKMRAENEKIAAESKRLEKLLRELRNTETSENKEEARQELAEMLSEQLDRDLQQREAGLAAIEERAKDLRKQLELRRSNKEKTIEMLLMIAENPTAGLGIPEQWLRVMAPSNNSAQDAGPVLLAPPTYPGPDARYYPSTIGSFPSAPSPPMFHPIDEYPPSVGKEYRIPNTQNTRQ